ncbi:MULTISPECIES: hypothetical protein [unclassified Fibrobacter]|uniref:hypothetical protein n=1 Tax=unclassified Fibrobacter TaxID=2634177 RepID=UPI00090EF668|nr:MULTISPECIES: hypothetical protein [unclassified Fibrobacter]OWV06134.1 hypothetical protein B7993_06120 [Fibrobacter sp. UWH3]SHK98735.1 hypothetical protein SAMN05720765_10797 [Fibrobacter sp. UWH6]
MNYCKSFLMLATSLAALSFAAKAPTHHSLRAEAMGNAHVAVVDDKEAIYFNYAGLSQINRLGNYKLRPEQGYYPRNIGDMRLNLGGAGPFETYFSTYNVAKDLQKIYNDANNTAKLLGLSSSKVLMDSLAAHPELIHKINNYDHKSLTMKIKMDAEMAFHGFGGAIWVDGNISPHLDGGLIIPYLAVDTFYVDGVAQAGVAYGFTDNLSVGVGVKAAKRHKVEMMTLDIMNYATLQDTLEDRYHDATDHILDFSSISMGMDLGVLYQLTREVRLGMSLRDVYFKDLAGDKITPNLSAGFNYSPRFFNKNTAYGRKFNFACDYADAFGKGNNYKPLSHVNFGLEVEQNILAWPGYNNAFRALALRVSGGFKGGYPTAGIAVEALRFFTLEIATWAEELGYYTGQDEERVYMAELSIGF